MLVNQFLYKFYKVTRHQSWDKIIQHNRTYPENISFVLFSFYNLQTANCLWSVYDIYIFFLFFMVLLIFYCVRCMNYVFINKSYEKKVSILFSSIHIGLIELIFNSFLLIY